MKLKKIALACMCCSFVVLTAQQTSPQTVSKKAQIGDSYRTEYYEVLKTNKTIKHGHYQVKIHDIILEDGYYKFGEKDSTWHSYNLSGVLIAEGAYLKGIPCGKWNYYNYKGKLEQTYDYDLREMLYFKPESPGKEQKYTVMIDDKYQDVILERPPLFVGGSEMIKRILTFNVKIPREAFESGNSGEVKIRLSIDENGTVTHYDIIESYGYGLDQAVLKAIQSMTLWVPARYQGKNIATAVNIPFKLKLSTSHSTNTQFPTHGF